MPMRRLVVLRTTSRPEWRRRSCRPSRTGTARTCSRRSAPSCRRRCGASRWRHSRKASCLRSVAGSRSPHTRRERGAHRARPAPTPGTPVGDAPAGHARPRVGVLALQGDFALHAAALESVGCEPVRVSLPEHLDQALAALVLPGGESTTMLRLLESTGLRAPLEAFVREKPVLGTCAGLILLSREADKLPAPTFGVLDVTTARNAWGRQVHSFTGEVDVPALGGAIEGVFIRAPRITRVGASVEVIATYEGEPVGVRQGHTVALTFHPELTTDRRVHAWFVHQVVHVEKRSSR